MIGLGWAMLYDTMIKKYEKEPNLNVKNQSQYYNRMA
jgi:hypothetical protein